MDDLRHGRLNQLRSRVRDALAEPAGWRGLPAVLDEFDTLRRTPARGVRATFWVDRFAQTLCQHGRGVDAGAAGRTAQALQPWLGAYDPVALARGRWVDLPKSYG